MWSLRAARTIGACNGWTFRRVLEELDCYLGDTHQPVPVNMRGPVQSEEPAREEIAQRIHQLLLRSKPHHPWAKAYLEYRGLHITELPETIRLVEKCAYFENGKYQDSYPALVLPLKRLDGEIVSVRRIYLAPEGHGKADLSEPKKVSRSLYHRALTSACVRIDEWATVMGAAEGFETAMAVRCATGLPVISTDTTHGMKTLELPKIVQTLVIYADNDQLKGGMRPGLDAAKELAKRMKGEGRTVVICMAPRTPIRISRDWLDVYVEDGPESIPMVFTAEQGCVDVFGVQYFELSRTSYVMGKQPNRGC